MSTAVLDQHTVLPPEGEQSGDLQRFADRFPREDQAKLVSPDGTEMVLPEEIYTVLRQVTDALASGYAISVAPLHAVLTTQQAADMLNISRPTLIKLLEAEEIPYERRGRHRKIRLADVVDYQRRSRSERRDAISELTRMAADDGTADKIDEFVQTR